MLASHTAVVAQSITLLESVTGTEYQAISQPLFSASIGMHMRHIIDHFNALIRGSDTLHVDYNVRSRHSETETNPALALQQLHDIQRWLSHLQPEQLSLSVTLAHEVNVDDEFVIHSTIARELIFCTSHAIHHYALVNIIRQLQGASTDNTFGLAPATIAFQQHNVN